MSEPTLRDNKAKSGFVRYTINEKKKVARVVNSTGGNVKKAQVELAKAGIIMHYTTIREYFHKYGDKEIKQVREDANTLKKFSSEQKKACVKIFETCEFISEKAIPIIKKDLGITIIPKRLRTWYKEYGKEVCEDNRFRDVVSNISNELAHQYKDVATSIVSLAFDAKKSALERVIELIPKEKDLFKLANVIKVLNEVKMVGDDDKPATLIQQFNSYFPTHETEKNRDKGDIQDVTPIP